MPEQVQSMEAPRCNLQYRTKGFISNALMLDTTGTCPPEAICLRLDHCAAVIDHSSLGTPHAVDAQSDLDEENFEARSTL